MNCCGYEIKIKVQYYEQYIEYHSYFDCLIFYFMKYQKVRDRMELLASTIRQHGHEENRFGNLSVTNISAEGKINL